MNEISKEGSACLAQHVLGYVFVDYSVGFEGLLVQVSLVHVDRIHKQPLLLVLDTLVASPVELEQLTVRVQVTAVAQLKVWVFHYTTNNLGQERRVFLFEEVQTHADRFGKLVEFI